eukprot:SAG25_NODE_13665_length_264_cov_0.630303_1_plen_57_part_10
MCVGHNPTAQEFGRAQRIEKRYDFQQECPEGERPQYNGCLGTVQRLTVASKSGRVAV